MTPSTAAKTSTMAGATRSWPRIPRREMRADMYPLNRQLRLEIDRIGSMLSSGPLRGVRVVELASIGPGPFAAMLLADLGADVLRIDRTGGANPLAEGAWNAMHRGRRSVAVDLKHPDGRELVLTLCEQADALLEGLRPGVT